MPRRSPRKTSKVILDYTEEQPTFTDYLALWVWLGWFVLLPTFFVVLAASYWYCKPLFFTLAGKFILLLAYPVSRDWQPAFCWKIGSWIMNASCRYFSCKVIFEDEDALKKMGPAVYALEPHDILPLGIFTLSENIEGIDVYGAKRGGMASILFRIPFMKQVYTWANAIAAPSRMLSCTYFLYVSACNSSGMVNMITSAQAAASAISMTFRPSPSALAFDAEPSRRATTRFFAPLSRRFSAWAWPWEP